MHLFLGVLFYTSDMSADVADAFFEGQLNMFITDLVLTVNSFTGFFCSEISRQCMI